MMESNLDVQVGGDHYKKYSIQPIEYVHANGIPFIEGSVIKYVTRWKDKNGIQDLEKAVHLLNMLIELEKQKKVCCEASNKDNECTSMTTKNGQSLQPCTLVPVNMDSTKPCISPWDLLAKLAK